mmetsp:Transcript_114459/g.363811  ORF Transcript_114459/g.363811 Transcript_114459/m.363811 type:complete len:417 (+) Transcript_114459:809-2059(+)
MRSVVGLVHVGVLGVHVFRQIDAALLGQPRGRALAEVHGGIAPVGRPDVGRALWVHVAGAVGVLVDPARQVAVRVDVAGALAAAQGDAEEAALADHLAAGDRRDLTVVDDLDGHVAELVPRDVLEDWNHLLLVHIRGHVREAVAPCCLTVCRNGTGGTATDGDNGARKLGSNVLHGLDDDVIVVLRVRVGHVPLRLSRAQDLTILHGHHLHIALAQVESDSAAVGHLAADHWQFHALRELLNRRHGGHGPGDAVDFRHGFGLEFILAAGAEGGGEGRAEIRRATEDEFQAAALPEHVPDHLPSEEHRGVETVVARREDGQLVAAAAASGPLHGEVELGDGILLRGLGDVLHVHPLAQHEGAEVRIQRSRYRRATKQVLHGLVGHHVIGARHGFDAGLRRGAKATTWKTRRQWSWSR